jgi:hypothetical protein
MEFRIGNLSGSIRLFGWPQNSRLESDLNSRWILVEQRVRFLFSEPDTSESCGNHPFKPFAQHASRWRRRNFMAPAQVRSLAVLLPVPSISSHPCSGPPSFPLNPASQELE